MPRLAASGAGQRRSWARAQISHASAQICHRRTVQLRRRNRSWHGRRRGRRRRRIGGLCGRFGRLRSGCRLDGLGNLGSFGRRWRLDSFRWSGFFGGLRGRSLFLGRLGLRQVSYSSHVRCGWLRRNGDGFLFNLFANDFGRRNDWRYRFRWRDRFRLALGFDRRTALIESSYAGWRYDRSDNWLRTSGRRRTCGASTLDQLHDSVAHLLIDSAKLVFYFNAMLLAQINQSLALHV